MQYPTTELCSKPSSITVQNFISKHLFIAYKLRNSNAHSHFKFSYFARIINFTIPNHSEDHYFTFPPFSPLVMA